MPRSSKAVAVDTSLVHASPPRPQMISGQNRSTSIITPQSATLTNARVVSVAEDGTETDLRPLSSADVLCGRGGLVNGYIGNVEYRQLVSTKREEYLEARKRDKADVARAIVQAVIDKGGKFLRRVDDASGKGAKGAKDGKVKMTDTGDARGSRWVDIGEDRAREKTSQALREGLDVRKTLNGAEPGSTAAAAAAAATDTTTTSKAKKRKSTKNVSVPVLPVAPDDGKIHLISFLPSSVASFLQTQSSTYKIVDTPEKFTEITATEEGKQLVAQRLQEWNSAVSANGHDRRNDWIACLGSVELWRRQVDIWCDGLLYLEAQQAAEDAAAKQASAPSPKKAKTKADGETVEV